MITIKPFGGQSNEEPPLCLDTDARCVSAAGLFLRQVRQLTDRMDMLRILPRAGLRRCRINL